MTIQYLRNYRLEITFDNQETLIINGNSNSFSSLRLTFDGTISIFGAINTFNIAIYNLNRSNFLRLEKDEADITKNITVKLDIGYSTSDALSTIFFGILHRGEPIKEGADKINKLECLDTFIDRNAKVNFTVLNTQEALKKIFASFKVLKRGKITPNLVNIKQPTTFNGNSIDQLKKLIPNDSTAKVFIYNNQINLLEDNQVLPSSIPVIDSASGLLSTPSRQQQRLDFSTYFNADVVIGGRCRLKSQVLPYLNDVYKIQQISYKGDTRGKDWTQTVSSFSLENFTVL